MNSQSETAEPQDSRDQQKARIEAVLKETRGRIAGPDGAAALTTWVERRRA